MTGFLDSAPPYRGGARHGYLGRVDYDPANDQILRSYEPSWRDQLALSLLGDGRPSVDWRRSVGMLLGTVGMGDIAENSAAELTPAASLIDAADQMHQGYYGKAARELAWASLMGIPVGKAFGAVRGLRPNASIMNGISNANLSFGMSPLAGYLLDSPDEMPLSAKSLRKIERGRPSENVEDRRPKSRSEDIWHKVTSLPSLLGSVVGEIFKDDDGLEEQEIKRGRPPFPKESGLSPYERYELERSRAIDRRDTFGAAGQMTRDMRRRKYLETPWYNMRFIGPADTVPGPGHA